MFKPNKIILHHSAVSRKDNDKQYEAIDNFHKSKGWKGIGYHFLLEPDGTVMKGRDEIKEGVHTAGENDSSFGVCMSGNFDEEEPTKAQLKALGSVLDYLRTKYDLPYDSVFFHRMFANKTCPGTKFTKSLLKSVMHLKELYRDEHGGFYFIKNGDNGKQKVKMDDSKQAISLLYTTISREFGIKTLSEKDLNSLKDKKYVPENNK